MTYTVHVKTEFAHLELREVLQSRPGVLLGVSDAAEATLATIPVRTVYDLALSGAFRDAARVVEAAADPHSVVGVAVNRALPVAQTVNGAATARTALNAILGACAAHGVADLNPVSYVLATAHHESAMGRYTTELSNGISTDTVFTRDAYFFNAIPGQKSSYNTLAGNIKAGKALKDAGEISTAEDVALWNGTAYPDAQPVAVKKAARKCDFMVFIGRGYVQVTGRANYAKFSNLASLAKLDLVAGPENAAKPAVAAGIMVLGMRDGMFRGNHKLADYDLPAKWDATNARNIVNADVATYGAKIRELAEKYKAALTQIAKLDESKPLA
ncbi:hypothetical protein [Nonomuraea sp. NPDC049695]|uniref:hypothetical protein n=1 Tax=Nonomuraea sp. NPDC049695 TaxID=3154734 RepID=UPI0034145318